MAELILKMKKNNAGMYGLHRCIVGFNRICRHRDICNVRMHVVPITTQNLIVDLLFLQKFHDF